MTRYQQELIHDLQEEIRTLQERMVAAKEEAHAALYWINQVDKDYDYAADKLRSVIAELDDDPR